MRHRIPTPPDAGVVNAVRFGTQTFRFLEGMQSRFEDLVAVPIPGRAPLVFVTNPELVHDVLSRPGDFGRVPAQGASALFAENGLVQSEGELWKQQRSIVGSAFAGDQVRAYADTVGERVETLAGEWADATGETRNLHREMTRLTSRVASEVLLGEDLGRERADQFGEWMGVAGAELEFTPTSVTPDWIPDRVSPEFRAAAEGVQDLAEEIIERRRAALAEDGDEDRPTDMLAMLIAAEDNPEFDLPTGQIRDEVVTFLIAGHETTALSLTYTQSLLSWHPAVRERIREEAREVIGDDTPGYEHVADLTHTKRAFREALRLYPPAWAVFRRATDDVGLGEYRVEEGSAVVTPQWSIHRDPRYFEDPMQFDLDRWERRDPKAVDAYFPFSSGPHACIGRQFSISGAALTIATLAREFDLAVPEDALEDLRATPTLRPADGVPATIHPAE